MPGTRQAQQDELDPSAAKAMGTGRQKGREQGQVQHGDQQKQGGPIKHRGGGGHRSTEKKRGMER